MEGLDNLTLLINAAGAGAALAGTYWIAGLAVLIGAYIFSGYTIMSIGRKVNMDEDWMAFLPVARQLYMLKMVGRPWWNLFFFKDAATVVVVVNLLLFWGLLNITKNGAICVIVILAYVVTILVFSFLYYRDFFRQFNCRTELAWVEIIPGFGMVGTVVKMLIAYSDVIFQANGSQRYESMPQDSVTQAGFQQNRTVTLQHRSAEITGISGQYRDASFDISDGREIALGRSAEQCQIVFGQEAGEISRLHCTIRYDVHTDDFYVTDFSTHGTYLENGSRLEKGVPRRVPRGTVLCLANRKNQLRLG